MTIARRQTLADLLRRSARRHPRKSPSPAARRPGATPDSTRCAAASPPASPPRASDGAAASPCWRATRTPGPRCASRWRAPARCWCRSTSCSRPTRRPTCCATRARGCWPSTPGSPRSAREAAALGSAVERLLALPGESSPEPQGDAMLSFARLAATDLPAPEADLDGRDLAQIVYTSGTESLPKGAMLTHEAVIWQYASCIVDGGMGEDDLVLHSLPLYHCAQLDCFLGPGVQLGTHQRDHRHALARQPAAAHGAPPHHLVLRAADGVDRAAALAAVRPHRPVGAAQGLLRRVDHAGRGAARDAAPAARGAPVELLRPDRDRAAGHRAQARGPAAQARLGRPAGAQRRDARRRRRDARRGAGRDRRDRAPLAAAAVGLLRRPGAHRRRLRGRLVPQRRPGGGRRRGLHQRRRPQEGHDQDRRRERRQPRGRGGDLRPAAGVGGGGGRPAASALDRGGDGGGGAQGGLHARRRRAGRPLPRAPRRLQGAARRGVRRRAAEEPERQAAQARAAHALRGALRRRAGREAS